MGNMFIDFESEPSANRAHGGSFNLPARIGCIERSENTLSFKMKCYKQSLRTVTADQRI